MNTQTPMKTKKQGHTPGPWEVRPSSNPKNGTGWRDIVSLGGEFSPSYVGEAQEQDAKLIAAAPEMLEALKEIAEQHAALLAEYGKPFGWGMLSVEKAQEIIAKATA